MKHISNSLEETQKIAEDFVTGLAPQEAGATVVGLYGNLGAGKTTFTQVVAKVLGVEEKVASPTFVIEKIYPIRTNGSKLPTSNGAGEFSHLIHVDAYRLESSDELIHLGWKEITSNAQNLIIVEWPEKVADVMPKHIKIYLKALENENSREITIEI